MKLSQDNEVPEGEVPSPKKQKPKKERKPLDKTIIGVLVGVVLGLLLTFTVSHFVYQSQIHDVRIQQLESLTQSRAEATAENVESYFESTSEKIRFYTENSLFRNALSKNDEQFITGYKNTITSDLKDVIAVQFIRRGEEAVNDEAFPPIRFSELELISKVLEGESVFPEAVRIDKKWYIHYMEPILSDDALPEGVIWVTSAVKNIKSVLLRDNDGLGKIKLSQNFSANSRFVVVQAGDAKLETSKSAPLGDSHWEIEFIASDRLLLQTQVNTGLVYAIIFAIFLSSLGAFVSLGYFVGHKVEEKLRRARLSKGVMRPRTMAAEGDGYVDPMYQSKDIFDVKIKEADESLLGMDDDENVTMAVAGEEESLSLDDDVFDMLGIDDGGDSSDFPNEVFRAYDIRGKAEQQINKKFAQALGQALGTEAIDARENTLVVARDARIHSPELGEWLMRGILSTGCNVINIGTVPTPLMYFALETLDDVNSGVMLTASHNGAEYTGFKIVLSGVTRSGDDIKALRKRMINSDFYSGQGQEHRHDVVSNYIDTIFSDVALAGELSVVVDAGNAVPGIVAPKLFEELGCRVIPLYCDLDGNFPNHDPDPSRAENLQDLIAKVKSEEADIGIALDGDGDRLTVVTPKGEIIWADRLLMAFTKDIISRNPGADVVFDVKCSRHLNTCITNYGGRPIMWKTGHALMKQKMVESGALVGGEYSGHIFIKDRWFGFDDGMYAAARLLEIISLQGEDIDTVFEEFPTSLITPEIRIEVGEERKFEIVDRLKESGDFGDGRLTLLDGIRVDYGNGWGLVRPSNTGPDITLRFEADDESAMHDLKSRFVKELRKIDNSIQVEWNQN